MLDQTSTAPTPPPKSEYECKHALYFTANNDTPNDLLLIKEYEYPPNGAPRIRRLRQVYNSKRPYYITKEPYQNHKDKKEWEKTQQKQDKQDNLSIRAAKKSITEHKKQLDDALNY